MSPTQCPRNFRDANFSFRDVVFEERTAISFTIALTTHSGAPAQSSFVRPFESRDRLRKCSSDRLRGWSGHVHESEKKSNSLSVLMSLRISARVRGIASLIAISQTILWPVSPHAHASLAKPDNANTASRTDLISTLPIVETQ